MRLIRNLSSWLPGCWLWIPVLPIDGKMSPGRIYGMRLEDFNITWRVAGGKLEVLEITPVDVV